jgi:hypothetical protein
MKRNVGTIDRSIRIIIGMCAVYLTLFPNALITNEILRIFVAVFGIGNLLVGLFLFCPLYTLADIDTRGRKRTAAPSE